MRITVIGAYLPRLDQAAIAQFVEQDVEGWRIAVPELQAKGFMREVTSSDVNWRCDEMREDLNRDLQNCALFELEVTDQTDELDPGNIGHPVTGLLGWAPAFLSADGSEVIHDGNTAPGSLGDFRLAIWIQDWVESTTLSSPWGDLELPRFEPVPARLWQLAPYELVD